MSGNKRVKKGHYLPRFYLAGFCDGDDGARLCVFDRQSAQTRLQRPSEVGHARYFYAIPGENPDAFEDALGKDEDKIAPIVRKVAEAIGVQPEAVELEHLVYFAALMRLRIPAYRRHYLAQLEQALGQVAEFSAAAPNAFERYAHQARIQGKSPMSRERFEEARQRILDGKLRFDVASSEHTVMIGRTVDHLTDLLRRRTWSVVWAPEDSGGFVTSDRPAILYWNFDDGADPSALAHLEPWEGARHAEFFLPLTRWCGLVGRAAAGVVCIERPSMVAELNTRVINASDRHIFAGDRALVWRSQQGVAGADELEEWMRELALASPVHDEVAEARRPNVVIVARDQLSDEQLAYLKERIRAPEHANDRGPITVWDLPQGVYIVLDAHSQLPIGIIESSGPRNQRTAGWWLDQRVRGRGIGSAMIDALAVRLKTEGVTGIGRIVIDTFRGEYQEPSAKLARRLKSHFLK